MLAPILDHQKKQLADLKKLRTAFPLTKSQRSLKQALSDKPQHFIFECKKASPSKGLLCSNYDPVVLAKAYAPFASAISVLTNEPFFQGSYEHLKAVASAVTCPVLAKDIIVSPVQIELARQYGADAVLLMLSVLNDEEYQACADTAQGLNLDIITEIHNEAELERALRLRASIIGINHRNFQTMEIDLSLTSILAPTIPSDVLVIAESGMGDYFDLKKLSPHAQSFLIGSSLSQASRPDIGVRTLLYRPIKICGLTRVQDAELAYQLGASYGGLIFVTHSERFLSLNQAKKLVKTPLQWVGVFQDASLETILEHVKALDLKVVQCHGRESVRYLQALRQALPLEVELWKAVSLQELHDYDHANVDKLLLDQATAGGTGLRVDLSAYQAPKHPVILAGGLSAESLPEVFHLPFVGFDFNSKLEIEPGVKSEQALRQLFEAIDLDRRSFHEN